MGVNPGHWRCAMCKLFVARERRVEFEHDFFHLVAAHTREGVWPVGCGPVEPALARQHLSEHIESEHADAERFVFDFEFRYGDDSLAYLLVAHRRAHGMYYDAWGLDVNHDEVIRAADASVRQAARATSMGTIASP